MGDMPDRIWIDPLSDERRYATNMLATGGYMGEPYVPEAALARARREAWEAGRDAAAAALAPIGEGTPLPTNVRSNESWRGQAVAIVRALTPPEEPPHD